MRRSKIEIGYGVKIHGYLFQVSPFWACVVCPPGQIFQKTYVFAWWKILIWESPFVKKLTVVPGEAARIIARITKTFSDMIPAIEMFGKAAPFAGISLSNFAEAVRKVEV